MWFWMLSNRKLCTTEKIEIIIIIILLLYIIYIIYNNKVFLFKNSKTLMSKVISYICYKFPLVVLILLTFPSSWVYYFLLLLSLFPDIINQGLKGFIRITSYIIHLTSYILPPLLPLFRRGLGGGFSHCHPDMTTVLFHFALTQKKFCLK